MFNILIGVIKKKRIRSMIDCRKNVTKKKRFEGYVKTKRRRENMSEENRVNRQIDKGKLIQSLKVCKETRKRFDEISILRLGLKQI